MKKNILFGLLLSSSIVFGMQEEDWKNRLLEIKIPETADAAHSIFAGDDFETHGRKTSHLGFALVFQKDGKPDLARILNCQDWGPQAWVDLSGPEYAHHAQERKEDSVPFEAGNKEWVYKVAIEAQSKSHVFIRVLKFLKPE
jgi:hypothetical protein